MKLGVIAGLASGLDLPDPRLRAAEAQGFAAAWLAVPDARASSLLLAASRLAVQTRSIGLGVVGALFEGLHPLRAAEDLAVLDLLCGGRLSCGLGGDVADPNRAEALAILRGAWTGEVFAHAGERWTFPELVCHPAPAQPGGPALYRPAPVHPAWRGCAASDGFVHAFDAGEPAEVVIVPVTCSAGDARLEAGALVGAAPELVAGLRERAAETGGDPLVLLEIAAGQGGDGAAAVAQRTLAEAAFG